MPGVIQRTLPVLSYLGLTVTALPLAAQAPAPALAHASAPAACRAGHRDDFTGTQLDRTRWTTVVRETADLRVAEGHLVIPTTHTDIIFAQGHPGQRPNPTPNLVLQALPQGPFTATAKLSLRARQAYQQAGLILYRDDDNYTKLVFYADGQDATARRVTFFREEQGAPSPGRRTPPLGADFPDSVWLRLVSDGQTVRAAYSADGTRFTEMSEGNTAGDGLVAVPVSLPGGASPKIGLLALAGTDQVPVVEARFDWFELCASQLPGR